MAAGCDDDAGRRTAGPGNGGKADDATDAGEKLELNPCEEQEALFYANGRPYDADAMEKDGVDRYAADKIIEARSGEDGRDGTKDDRPFRSIAELEEAVGAEAAAQVVDAARDELAWDCQSPRYADDPVRIVAANLSSGRYQKYDEGHGNRILEAVDGDIVLLQECNYGDQSEEAIGAWVEDTFGDDYELVHGSAELPNGIATHFPILDWGVWEDTKVSNRDFLWARIDIPGDRDLWAVSVHLLTKSSSVRDEEAEALVGYLEDVPEDDYIVVGGDFNTKHHGEYAYRTLSEVVVTHGPYPADADGNVYTNSSRRYPYDGVYVSENLAERAAVSRQGTSTFPLGLVVDTRTYDPIGDLAPAEEDDSAAFQMQHMAVVRDFDIDGD